MKCKFIVFALGLIAAPSSFAQERVKVITATEDLASIVREVGGSVLRIAARGSRRGACGVGMIDAALSSDGIGLLLVLLRGRRRASSRLES